MTKNIFFNNYIAEDTVMDLMEIMDECVNGLELPIDKVILNWSSDGGSYSALTMLVNYINEYPIDVEIVVYDMCASAGFMFLLYVDRPIKMLDIAHAMLHLPNINIGMRGLRDPKSEETFVKSVLSRLDEKFLKEFELCGLTEEELEIIKSGRDLYLDRERFSEVIDSYDSSLQNEEIGFKIESLEEEIKFLKEQVK